VIGHQDLPRWAEIGLIPILNVLLALGVAGIIIAALGENPFDALLVMFKGAFVYQGALGYTLYYTTNFIFTGLAVAVAFHAMLFNIGGEGQAYLGGLGIALICLSLEAYLPALMVVVLAVVGSAIVGAIWGAIPGWLQAKRGSHVVITTIMFNFLAASIMVSLLSGILKNPGRMSPETRAFSESTVLPFIHDIFAGLGIELARSPLNLAFVIALLCCVFVWILIWRTRLGYAIRVTGHSATAAEYAGINITKTITITMAISGGLAGMMAINEILGVQHRLILNFTSGYGFTGIAVALMGRNHPVGVIMASLLFGALFQGGAELDFEFESITRDMVLLIQGLVILFSGGLAYMLNRPVSALLRLVLNDHKRYKTVTHE
jgi:ABC-type uncharacterized transport system permease subunit